MTLVDQHVPFAGRRDRRNDQYDRPFLVVPPIAKGSTRSLILGVPPWESGRDNLLANHVLRNIDRDDTLRLWNVTKWKMYELFKSRARIGFGAVDHEATRRIPPATVAKCPVPIENRMTYVSDSECLHAGIP